MRHEEAIELLNKIHEKLLLHEDAGTTRMESKPDFWNVFYGFERELAEKLDDK